MNDDEFRALLLSGLAEYERDKNFGSDVALPRKVRLVGCMDDGSDRDMVIEHLTRDGLQQSIEKGWPELWAKCYPRLYDSPILSDYYSPKIPAFDMAATVLKQFMPLKGKAESYDFILANRLAMFNMPTFFLSREIATAIRNTSPPHAFEWHDMALPFDAAIFMLPKGFLRHDVDGECAYVAYSRCRENMTYDAPLQPRHHFGILNGGFLVFTAAIEPPRTYHYHWPFADYEGIQGQASPVIQLRDLDNSMQAFADDTNTFFFPKGMEPADEELIREAAHYVFGALVLMLNRPDMITRGSLRKRVKQAGAIRPREFWSPNIIGEHYHVRREYISQGGTHASPRGHWVRGSWRNQAHGPKRSLRREMWVEPYWRGGETE